jgi:hypothetical protein
VGEADRHRVHPRLRGGVRHDVAGRADRPRARDVDDRAAAAGRHALADERDSRNGPLRLTATTLSNSSSVTSRALVERRDAGVVDEHVDAAEVA